MEISPRYDAAPVIEMDGPIDDQRTTVVRQRRRLETLLSAFGDEQWQTPSRCDGWTAQDVVAHLTGTNHFWRLAIEAGLAGTPSRMLVGFDPKATPAAMVAAAQGMSPTETFDKFAASNRSLCDAFDALDAEEWSTMAETPLGHVPIRVLALHALWDAWVHERDILLPQGVQPVQEVDELEACLRYAAALGPALGLAAGATRRGALVVEATDPSMRVVVEVDGVARVHGGDPPDGALTLHGRAAELVDVLSVRAPVEQHVVDDQRWLVASLAEVFEVDTAVA